MKTTFHHECPEGKENVSMNWVEVCKYDGDKSNMMGIMVYYIDMWEDIMMEIMNKIVEIMTQF